ncbi:hypothetical protein HID58_015597 [Brassica napus]|uniref:Uncharacterized protein n=1 Tax=Brassica napus TaxID=3708 RepID=A0ABQ8DKK1_BRANA|nr:hypothetical protein HID58_015597 [Brassica napus]
MFFIFSFIKCFWISLALWDLRHHVIYKFTTYISPIFDGISVTALVIYATRVVLGYKQTSYRYQLLVIKTLYEKTLASGFGSVHILLDASEQQQKRPPSLQRGNIDTCNYPSSVKKSAQAFPQKLKNRLYKYRICLTKDLEIDARDSCLCFQFKELWNGLLG